MISYRAYFVTVLLLTFMDLSLLAQAAEPVSKSYFGGVAIGGHDSVSYHSESAISQHQSATGQKNYTVEYKGATWHFINKENAALFKASPQNYAPAYNGHCANALSLGEGLVKTDGTHWEIFSDQLYLFYAGAGRESWLLGDFLAIKAAADKAWQAMLAD